MVASGLPVEVTHSVALRDGEPLPLTPGDADELTRPLALALTASVADGVRQPLDDGDELSVVDIVTHDDAVSDGDGEPLSE